MCSNDTAVAWSAGFFDGEGCVNLIWKKPVSSKSYGWYVQIVLTNCDRRALERFVEAVGEGRIYARRPIPNRRQIYYVLATSGVAQRILEKLLPYLISKRDVATLALEARALGQARPFGRTSETAWARLIEIENEIKALNGINSKKVMGTDRSRPYASLHTTILRNPATPANIWLTHGDKTLRMAEWSRLTGIKVGTLSARLARGWTLEEALTIPVTVSQTHRQSHT